MQQTFDKKYHGIIFDLDGTLVNSLEISSTRPT